MPELPEVETIRRQLAPHVEGRTIVQARILDPRWTRPDPPAAVEAELRGAVVERLSRAGKYLIWSLSRDRFLIQHLRMTGTLLYDPAVAPPHTHVIVRVRRRSSPRVRRSAPVRDGPSRFRCGGAGRVPVGSDRDRAAHARVHHGAPARARPRPDRARQGVRARPAPDRRRREHLRRRGAVPGPDPSAARGGPAHARRLGARARGNRGGAERRHRGQGRVNRRLPSRRRRAGLLPGPVPRAPPGRRGLPTVRSGDPQDRRGGKGDVRVRAVSAQAARCSSARRPSPHGSRERSLRREKLAEPSRAVRRDQLVEPADRFVADQDLREREHPGSLD